MGKSLVILGIFFIIIGLGFEYGGKTITSKLPVDIFLRGKNYSFYFPIVSSLILSVFATLFLFLWSCSSGR